MGMHIFVCRASNGFLHVLVSFFAGGGGRRWGDGAGVERNKQSLYLS